MNWSQFFTGAGTGTALGLFLIMLGLVNGWW